MANAVNLHNLSNETLVAAIEATNSPLIITDNQQDDNPIIYTNQAFLDLCGYDRDEIIGRNCRFLQGDDTDGKAVTKIRKAVAKGESTRINLRNYRKDGTMFWNDLLISPLHNDKGEVTHFIGMQLDITDRIEYTKKLEKVRADLTRSNNELEQFTYAASHDLQEPLRMVSSYLQLIKRRYAKNFDKNGIEFLDFATEGAERMQALINDLLSLSRVSTVTGKFKSIPLKDLIDKASFNLKLQISETNADIEYNGNERVLVDSAQMVQLLQNIISNAIKYRRAGTDPHITITVKEDKDKQVIAIQDNGIGIEPSYHERIFTIFQRLHTRDEYEGTGVGLALCRKIIDRHNGKIWVDSDGSSGSTFLICLPTKRKN